MNQREKAEERVEDLRNGGHGYHEIAYGLQVAVDEAAALIDRLLGEVVGPFADKTIADESADWLSRNERKEV